MMRSASILFILFITVQAHSQLACRHLFRTSVFDYGRYASFEELSRYEVEGRDYFVSIQDLRKPITVFAVHGGNIEKATSDLAKAIAGHRHNYYSFEVYKKNAADLHITSSRFNEPRALYLAQRSLVNISIHGYGEKPRCVICIGGLNKELAQKILSLFKKKGLKEWELEYPCKPFPGTHPNNIVNQSVKHGVQIEISEKLRMQLLHSKNDFDLFVRIIQEALE